MKQCAIFLLAVLLLTLLSGCTVEDTKPTPTEPTRKQEKTMLKIEIGDHVLYAEIAPTCGAGVLEEKLYHESLTIPVSNYGGWEKVGMLPWYLPSADEKITAKPGDIMLYNAQSIVLFYGENTWEYTRLGTILDCDASTLANVLGGEETEMTLSLVVE